jgi:nitrogen regulatory protein P-II 1
MKKIEAIIRPIKVNEVRDALSEIGVTGMMVIEVKGYGRHKGHTEMYKGSELQVDFQPKVKIEIVVSDNICEKVIEVILSNSKTGQIGDGKIFVSNVERAIRIRTADEGDIAL